MEKKYHSSDESDRRTYAVSRERVALTAEGVKNAGEDLLSRLSESDKLLTKIRAWPLENDAGHPSNVFRRDLIAITVGLAVAVFLAMYLLKQPTGNNVIAQALETAYGLDNTLALTLLGYVMVSLMSAIIVVFGGWISFWKLVKLFPGIPRGDKTIGLEIHGTDGNEVAFNYFGNLPNVEMKRTISDLHQGNVIIQELSESEARLWDFDDRPADIRVGTIETSTNQVGDQFGCSLSPAEALASQDSDRYNPLGRIIHQILKCDTPIHIQILTQAVRGGEHFRSQKIRGHQNRDKIPEDRTRAKSVEEASGKYLTLTIRMLAEVPKGDRKADKAAQDAFDAITRTIRHMPAEGVSVKLTPESTLQSPSFADKALDLIPLRNQNTAVDQVLESYLNREFDAKYSVTMEAKTSALLFAVPGDSDDNLMNTASYLGVHELPQTSLTPAAENELISEYDPKIDADTPDTIDLEDYSEGFKTDNIFEEDA